MNWNWILIFVLIAAGYLMGIFSIFWFAGHFNLVISTRDSLNRLLKKAGYNIKLGEEKK